MSTKEISQSIALDKSKSGQLSWKERISYGCGDTACNVVYGVVGTLLTLFYTDYAGIPIMTVGLVLMISRVFDGISDLIMGFVVERTNSKWGKARPWLLWMAVPYAITAVAMFAVPQTSSTLQFWYIFVSYNACTTFIYTAINVPYGTLSSLMTRDSHERSILSVVRQSMSPLGRMVVVTCTMPLVKLFGDDQMAWVKAMSIWSVMAIALLLICFKNCVERVEFQAEQRQKVSVGTSIKALFSNQYFWAVILLWTATCMHVTVIGTVLPYYSRYILNNDGWMYSVLYFTEMLFLIIGAALCPTLLKKFKTSKKTLSLIGCIIVILSQFLFMLNPTSFKWAMFTGIIRTLGSAPLTGLIFGMIGDVIEFGHWKTGIRQESLIFGAGSLGFKIGTGIASAIISMLMEKSGYISSTLGGVAQPDTVKHMIVRIFELGPILVWLVALIVLVFYKLDKI